MSTENHLKNQRTTNPFKTDLLSLLNPIQWHSIRESILASFKIQEPKKESLSKKSHYNKQISRLPYDFSDFLSSSFALCPIPPGETLSVVVPVYNEERLIEKAIRELATVPVVDQVIIVNDGSTDRTDQLCRKLQQEAKEKVAIDSLGILLPHGLHYKKLDKNKGKGFAIRKGFEEASCKWVSIQDADQEYDPKDFIRLLHAAISNESTVVYGDRFAKEIQLNQTNCRKWITDESAIETLFEFLPKQSSETEPVSPRWHQNANLFLSKIASFRCRQTIRDIETCQKLFDTNLIQSICPSLTEDRFGIEKGMTIKLSREKNFRFSQTPISYFRRSYEEGKKIGLKDGIRALYCLFAY